MGELSLFLFVRRQFMQPAFARNNLLGDTLLWDHLSRNNRLAIHRFIQARSALFCRSEAYPRPSLFFCDPRSAGLTVRTYDGLIAWLDPSQMSDRVRMLFADMGHRTDRNPLRLSHLGRGWAGDDGSMGLASLFLTISAQWRWCRRLWHRRLRLESAARVGS